MTVTGNAQRRYGTLSGGCIIDLHRFALVSGSTTLSPLESTTVTYADTTPYKQCGYKYSGYLTLFLSVSGPSIYASVEIRICRNDAKRIVIETYGEVARSITGGMALWFNNGTDIEPNWVKLNSTSSGVIMSYATTSYTFNETIRNGSITIDCCKKCPDTCGCKSCNITSRLSISRNIFDIDGYMVEHTIGNVGYSTLYIKFNYVTIFEISTPDPGSTIYTSSQIPIGEPAYYSPEDYPEHLLPPRNDPSKNACYIVCDNQHDTSITDYCSGWIEYDVIDNHIYFWAKFRFEAGSPYNPDNYGPEYISPVYTTDLPFDYTGGVILLYSKYNYGLYNLGTETLLYYWDGDGRKVSIFIEYKFSRDTIYLWVYTDENSPSMYVLITYLDDLSISHELYKGPVKDILI